MIKEGHLSKAELELGLKKDVLGPLDGSSLEALLKGEPLDKRVTTELRPAEEETSLAEITGTSTASSHSGSTRIRKVHSRAFQYILYTHNWWIFIHECMA